MPELPEVETVRRGLERRLVGRTVRRVCLHRRDIVVTPDDAPGGIARQRRRPATAQRNVGYEELLAGATIESVLRHGKQLALVGRSGQDQHVLVIHLGMTGNMRLHAPEAGATSQASTHVHATWELDDGWLMYFQDPRRFGGLWVLRSMEELRRRWAQLGPDALQVTAAALGRALAGVRRRIKAALLDQSVLAGVGNIYADESLFMARLHPQRRASSLAGAELARLAQAIRMVLRESIRAGGSSIRDYRSPDNGTGWYQTRHRVYGRGGERCLRCGTTLGEVRVAQRATVFCPRCQSRRKPSKRSKLSTSRIRGASPSLFIRTRENNHLK
jgi:formamidopyrimidine-DNA glycosylase